MNINSNKMSEDLETKEEKKDEYTEAIGEMGRWQIVIFFLTAFPVKLVLPSVHLGIIFMAPKTTFRCVQRRNEIEPIENMTCYSDCEQYEYFSEFEKTIIMQWDLICDRAWLADFAQTICMFGVFVGSIVFGYISDRYGRRLTLIYAGILQTCMSFVMPFCLDLWSFIVIRFFLGASTGGTMITSFVLLMEIFGARKRDLLGSIYMLPLCAGHLLIALIVYFFRNWRGFSVGMAIPTLIFLTYPFFLPESPKWLISVGRLEEASEVMTSAAKWNKLCADNMMTRVEIIAKEMENNKTKSRKANLIDLIRLRSLRLKTIFSCLLWLLCGFAFYGTFQYFGQTTANIFLAVALQGLIQVPSLFAGAYISNRFGRRIALVTCFVINAVGNALLNLPDEHFYVKLMAGIVCTAGADAALSIIYVYTTELFPTVARNMGMGSSSTCNRVGSMVAPFIGGLRTTAFWVPPTVFAVANIVCIAVCYCLPETRGKKIKEYLDED